MKPNIGIEEQYRKEIVQGLSRVLADTYSLYLKTHAFHWNVTGPLFNTLHLMFETQYNELWLAVDLVAERIRALGELSPGSYTDFAKLTAIKESNSSHGPVQATEMIKQLLEGHETVARTARSVFPIAEKGQDEASLDMLTGRITLHEKTAWMLRSLLEG